MSYLINLEMNLNDELLIQEALELEWYDFDKIDSMVGLAVLPDTKERLRKIQQILHEKKLYLDDKVKELHENEHYRT